MVRAHRLSRESDDGVGGDRGVRQLGSDVGHDGLELCGGVAAAHVAQDVVVARLKQGGGYIYMYIYVYMYVCVCICIL